MKLQVGEKAPEFELRSDTMERGRAVGSQREGPVFPSTAASDGPSGRAAISGPKSPCGCTGALLDHLYRGAAVLGKTFQVGSLRKRPRDECMPRRVELSRPDAEAAKTSEPDSLRLVIDGPPGCPSFRPPSVRHGPPFRGQEDEFFPVRMKPSRQSLHEINGPSEHPVSRLLLRNWRGYIVPQHHTAPLPARHAPVGSR
jgi:hypothetical protein